MCINFFSHVTPLEQLRTVRHTTYPERDGGRPRYPPAYRQRRALQQEATLAPRGTTTGAQGLPKRLRPELWRGGGCGTSSVCSGAAARP